MTTTVGDKGDALNHFKKMVDLVRKDEPSKVQQDIWFAVKAMRDLYWLDSKEVVRINALLRVGAHLDAARYIKHPAYTLERLEKSEAGYTATLKRNRDDWVIWDSGRTPAAALAAASFLSWEAEQVLSQRAARGEW